MRKTKSYMRIMKLFDVFDDERKENGRKT